MPETQVIPWLTPEVLFLLTYIMSGVSGCAELLLSDKPLTVRHILGKFILYGGAGVGLGWIAYEFFGGARRPGLVVVAGMLVGVRVVLFTDIREAVRKTLLALAGDGGTNNNRKDDL